METGGPFLSSRGHTVHGGFFRLECLRGKAGFPELSRAFVLSVRLMSNGLVQAVHKPANTGKPCPPDVDDVGDGRSLARIALNPRRSGSFESGSAL
jgi:hypothetical protein